MKRSFMIAIVLLVTMGAGAQTIKEVYVGYSLVMEHYKFSSSSYTESGTDKGSGVEVGFNFIRPISKPFAVTYGIQALYGWDDGINQRLDAGQKDRFIKCLVPVSLLCEFRPSNKNFAIEPFVGINGSFYMYGKSKLNGTTYDWFDSNYSLNVNRMQIGWHVGVNFVFGRYVATVNYQQDFTNVHSEVVNYMGVGHYDYNHWANMEIRLGYRF